MRSVNLARTDDFVRARALRTADEGFSDTVARPSSPQSSVLLASVLDFNFSLRAVARLTVSAACRARRLGSSR